MTQSVQKLINLRDNLQGEVKACVDQAILQANTQVIRIAKQAQRKAGLLTMTAVEAMERDEQRQWAEKDTTGPRVSPEDKLPPPSTAPAIVEDSRKRPRKHTTVYREAFGDSQEDPTAGIKRGRAGGIL
jgi:hypothetical protein